jgi:hypothetical protein
VKAQHIHTALVPDHLYLLTHDAASSSTELHRVPIDGGGAKRLAKLNGAGAPTSIAATATHVFFARGGDLYEAYGEAEAEVVAASFGSVITVHQAHVYGAGFDAESRTNRFKRLPLGGGAVVTIGSVAGEARWPRAITALLVHGKRIFASDARQDRVYSMALGDGSTNELMNNVDHPTALRLIAGGLVFNSSSGSFRVPVLPGASEKPERYGPFGYGLSMSVRAADTRFVYVEGTDPYAKVLTMYRVPKEGGEPQQVASFANDLHWVGVDDSCMYVVRGRPNNVTLVQALKVPTSTVPR